jgi:hypothetical protein
MILNLNVVVAMLFVAATTMKRILDEMILEFLASKSG